MSGSFIGNTLRDTQFFYVFEQFIAEQYLLFDDILIISHSFTMFSNSTQVWNSPDGAPGAISISPFKFGIYYTT